MITHPLAVSHVSCLCRVWSELMLSRSSSLPRVTTAHPFVSPAVEFSQDGEGNGEQQQHSLPGLQSRTEVEAPVGLSWYAQKSLLM